MALDRGHKAAITYTPELERRGCQFQQAVEVAEDDHFAAGARTQFGQRYYVDLLAEEVSPLRIVPVGLVAARRELQQRCGRCGARHTAGGAPRAATAEPEGISGR